MSQQFSLANTQGHTVPGLDWPWACQQSYQHLDSVTDWH